MEAVGYKLVAADAQIGSGPVAVYGLNVVSGGSGGSVTLRNGTSASGTAVIIETGTASSGVTFSYNGLGIVFPSGCFCDIDSNVSTATIFYQNLS